MMELDAGLPGETARAVAARLRKGAARAGVLLSVRTPKATGPGTAAVSTGQGGQSPNFQEGYFLGISAKGVRIEYRDTGGLRAAVATFRQLLREFGRRLPLVEIEDYPDFRRRGLMLDVSRGRVPRLETLLELADFLADFKINELQLYTEHTFAYHRYRSVWRDWGALTGSEIRRLDARCRELGIDLVPNQNSFGHLREWLAHPRLRKLAEVSKPYPAPAGGFLRHPSTLAPSHPGTLPFLRSLYDELLPNFSSAFFNVGCDETWDLGRGQSAELCERKGRGRVYLDFLKQIHRETRTRGRRMMFWGDIVLRHPELIPALPRDCIALNWGYEADHPFKRETRRFARSGIPFYVCPGTSTWATLIGRHDNALANLAAAARAGRENGAAGYLIADWGDSGHPQPLAVSYLPYVAGAGFGWCGKTFALSSLMPVLSRDIFGDSTRRLAEAAWRLGLAHLKLRHEVLNETPLGAVLAAPKAGSMELFCREGLKYYSRIRARNIRAALRVIENQVIRIRHVRSRDELGRTLARELEFAARMAAESCHYMLWQQAVAARKDSIARKMSSSGIRRLRRLEREFNDFWSKRNKGTPNKCSAFLGWRMEEYRRGGYQGPCTAALLKMGRRPLRSVEARNRAQRAVRRRLGAARDEPGQQRLRPGVGNP
jgi:hypothetical protein